MADLNTKSLDEYPTIEETADGDTVLIERDGRIKRLSASNVGGNGVVIDITEKTSNTVSNEEFNTLLKALDNFSTIYLKCLAPLDIDIVNDEGTVYKLILSFEYVHDTSGAYNVSYELVIGTDSSTHYFFPISETGLYVPQNIVINEVAFPVIDPVA